MTNFDPGWPQYCSVFGSPANATFNVLYSGWSTVSENGSLVGTGAYTLNSNLPLPPVLSLSVGTILQARGATYGSGHPGGANFVFCDGSVHFLSNAISNGPMLMYLSTRAGGEVVDGSSF
jgi:prepilin-type processing-associated H-X9-DG protein